MRRSDPIILMIIVVGLGWGQVLADTPTAKTDRVAHPAASVSETTKQKLKLLEKMLQSSPAAQRIKTSNNDAALTKFANAQNALQSAREAMAAGAETKADELINLGLRTASEAARIVADPDKHKAVLQRRFDDIQQRVKSFRDAFVQIIEEKGPEIAGLADLQRVDKQLEQARILAENNDLTAATSLISAIAEQLEQALAEARRAETVVYTVSFKTPAEEYDYELERNKSHLRLLQTLMAERAPSHTLQTMIDDLIDKSAALHARAETESASGHFEPAIVSLEDSTRQLIRALRLGGLNLP